MSGGERIDVVVIGAGHNALVCSALLARSGLRVLVLERSDRAGGVAQVEEVWPGIELPVGLHDASSFRPDLVDKLRLESFGLSSLKGQHGLTTLLGSPGGPLLLPSDSERAGKALSALSSRDAHQFPSFCRVVQEMAGFLGSVFREDPPDLARLHSFGQIVHLLRTGLRFRGLGRDGMRRMLRTLPMSLSDFLEEWFESPALRALLAGPVLLAQPHGPMAPGTAALFLYHHIGETSGAVRGFEIMGRSPSVLVAALESCARSHGVQIRFGAEVGAIRQVGGEVAGVELADGESIDAPVVISALDPRTTFLGLVGSSNLDPSFVREVKRIRYRGAVARVQLHLSRPPSWTKVNGETNDEVNRSWILLGADLIHLEKATDAARKRCIDPERIVGEAVVVKPLNSDGDSKGRVGMSVLVRHMPDEGSAEEWIEWSDLLANAVVDELGRHAPDLPGSVLDRCVLTPIDFETRFGLHAGHLYQGEMSLSQAHLMRPMVGWARHQTPLSGLYLAGSGAHPGPGLTGGPGAGAARAVLRDR